jgi:hypothetical protein
VGHDRGLAALVDLEEPLANVGSQPAGVAPDEEIAAGGQAVVDKSDDN